jgi:hypothetical protein
MMNLNAARVATFLYDNLRISGNLSIHSLPTAWLESLPLPSDFTLADIRNLMKNGYLLPGDLIAADLAGDQNFIVLQQQEHCSSSSRSIAAAAAAAAALQQH